MKRELPSEYIEKKLTLLLFLIKTGYSEGKAYVTFSEIANKKVRDAFYWQFFKFQSIIMFSFDSF